MSLDDRHNYLGRKVIDHEHDVPWNEKVHRALGQWPWARINRPAKRGPKEWT